MNIYSFLFDIIKLLATLSMGILSLSIAFADKLNLDFTDGKVKRAVSSLWLSLVLTLVLSIVAGFFIYNDIAQTIITGVVEINRGTKISTIAALIFFGIALFSLIKIGNVIVKQKSQLPVK